MAKNELPKKERPLKRYVIVTATSVPHLEDKVGEYLADGYTLAGGLCVEGEQGALHQALVLPV